MNMESYDEVDDLRRTPHIERTPPKDWNQPRIARKPAKERLLDPEQAEQQFTYATQYECLLSSVAQSIAHPRTDITTEDKHKAVKVIMKVSRNNRMLDYLFSQLSETEKEDIRAIA